MSEIERDVEAAIEAMHTKGGYVPPEHEAQTVFIDERPACPRCGAPMNASAGFACGRGFSVPFELPPTCTNAECRKAGQRERDEAAIARAIAAGVIDP